MQPSLLYEILASDEVLNSALGLKRRIYEDMSLDQRPTSDGLFAVISLNDSNLTTVAPLDRGPRTIVVAVHQPWNLSRSFNKINAVLDRIYQLYSSVSQQSGEDGIRITQIMLKGRGAQRTDPGWETLTRTATYGVLYSETAA